MKNHSLSILVALTMIFLSSPLRADNSAGEAVPGYDGTSPSSEASDKNQSSCETDLLAQKYEQDLQGTFGMKSPFELCTGAAPSEKQLDKPLTFEASLAERYPAVSQISSLRTRAQTCALPNNALSKEDLVTAQHLAMTERYSSIERLQRGVTELSQEHLWLNSLLSERPPDNSFCTSLSSSKNQCLAGLTPDCSKSGPEMFNSLEKSLQSQWNTLKDLERIVDQEENKPLRRQDSKKLRAAKNSIELIKKLSPWLTQEEFLTRIKSKPSDFQGALKGQIQANLKQVRHRLKDYDNTIRCLSKGNSGDCGNYDEVMATAPPLSFTDGKSSSPPKTKESLYQNAYLKMVDCLQFQRVKKNSVKELYGEAMLSGGLSILSGGWIAVARLATMSRAMRLGKSVWDQTRIGKMLARSTKFNREKLALLGVDGQRMVDTAANAAESYATCDGGAESLERLISQEAEPPRSCEDRKSFFTLKTNYQNCIMAMVSSVALESSPLLAHIPLKTLTPIKKIPLNTRTKADAIIAEMKSNPQKVIANSKLSEEERRSAIREMLGGLIGPEKVTDKMIEGAMAAHHSHGKEVFTLSVGDLLKASKILKREAGLSDPEVRRALISSGLVGNPPDHLEGDFLRLVGKSKNNIPLNELTDKLNGMKKDPKADPREILALDEEIQFLRESKKNKEDTLDFEELLGRSFEPKEGQTLSTNDRSPQRDLDLFDSSRSERVGPLFKSDADIQLNENSKRELESLLNKKVGTTLDPSTERLNSKIQFNNGVTLDIDANGQILKTNLGYSHHLEIEKMTQQFNALEGKAGFKAYQSKEGELLLNKIAQLKYPDEPFTAAERKQFEALKLIDKKSVFFGPGIQKYFKDMDLIVSQKKRFTDEDQALVRELDKLKRAPETNRRQMREGIITQIKEINKSAANDPSRLSTPAVGDYRPLVGISVEKARELESIVRRPYHDIDNLEPQEKATIEEFLRKAKRLDSDSQQKPAIQFYLKRLELYDELLRVPRP